jgi:hypothetical protein
MGLEASRWEGRIPRASLGRRGPHSQTCGELARGWLGGVATKVACSTSPCARLPTPPAPNRITLVFDEVVRGKALDVGNGGLPKVRRGLLK